MGGGRSVGYGHIIPPSPPRGCKTSADNGKCPKYCTLRRLPPDPSYGITASHQPAVDAPAPPPQSVVPMPHTQAYQHRRLNTAHQGTLAIATENPPRDTDLSAFPGIFNFMDHKAGTYPCSRLKRLVILPQAERPPLVIYVETLYPHIRFLWGLKYLMPSFTWNTPKHGKVLAFYRDVRQG